MKTLTDLTVDNIVQLIGYIFVKDSEGYVFKKTASEITSDEKIISEKEYMKISGLSSYEKKFGQGVAKEHALYTKVKKQILTPCVRI